MMQSMPLTARITAATDQTNAFRILEPLRRAIHA
jgi:hypothetical protein